MANIHKLSMTIQSFTGSPHTRLFKNLLRLSLIWLFRQIKIAVETNTQTNPTCHESRGTILRPHPKLSGSHPKPVSRKIDHTINKNNQTDNPGRSVFLCSFMACRRKLIFRWISHRVVRTQTQNSQIKNGNKRERSARYLSDERTTSPVQLMRKTKNNKTIVFW